MKKLFIIIAILFQIVVLAYMAGEREYILSTGKTIWLRTAPIDPRDIFRGDYVRLEYDISAIPSKNLKGNLREDLKKDCAYRLKQKKGRKVYTVLKENSGGVAEYFYATDEKPESGLFIKGRLIDDWRFISTNNGISIKYGIEAYFVQQGKGIEIENQQRNRTTGIQIPLEMAVALGRNGTAIIKKHRWSALGIGTEVIERPVQNVPNGRKSVKVRLTLMNASDKPLELVNLPDYGSFSLEPVLWARKDWQIAHSSEPIMPSPGDMIRLAPNQKESFDFDFALPRWFVKADAEPVEIGTLEWSERFRLVYRPPSQKDCRELPDKDMIWHGYLPSRAFHGAENID